MEQILSNHFVNMSELKAHPAQLMTSLSAGPLAVLSHKEVKGYLVSKELMSEYRDLRLAQEMDQRDLEVSAGKGVKLKVSADGKINYFGS